MASRKKEYSGGFGPREQSTAAVLDLEPIKHSGSSGSRGEIPHSGVTTLWVVGHSNNPGFVKAGAGVTRTHEWQDTTVVWTPGNTEQCSNDPTHQRGRASEQLKLQWAHPIPGRWGTMAVWLGMQDTVSAWPQNVWLRGSVGPLNP